MAPVVRRSIAANPGATRKSLRNSSLSPTPRREPPLKKKLSTLKKAKQVDSNIEKEEVIEVVDNDNEKEVVDNHDEANDEEDDDDAPLIRHRDVILKKKAKGTAVATGGGGGGSTTTGSESVPQRRSKRSGLSIPAAEAATGTTRKARGTKRTTSTGGNDSQLVINGETDTVATDSKSHLDSKTKRKSFGATTVKAVAGDDPLEGSMSSSVSSLSVSTRRQPVAAAAAIQRRGTRRSSTPISNAVTSTSLEPPPNPPVESTTKHLQKEETEEAKNRNEETNEPEDQIVTAAGDSKVETITQSTTMIDDEPPKISQPSEQSSFGPPKSTTPGPTTLGESSIPAIHTEPNNPTTSITTDSELVPMETNADSLPTACPTTEATAVPTSPDLPAATEEDDRIVEQGSTDKRGTTTVPYGSPMVTLATAQVASPEMISRTAPDDHGSAKTDAMDVVVVATTPNVDTGMASLDETHMNVDSHDIGVGEAVETKEPKKSDDTSIPSSETCVPIRVQTATIDAERKSIPVVVNNYGQQSTSAAPTSSENIEMDSEPSNKQPEKGNRDHVPVDSKVETTMTKIPASPNDEHAMEVDDLVCQEDESAFDYPIPTPQTNRPSNIHHKEKPKAGFKATALTNSPNPFQNVAPVPSIAVLPASSETKHSMMANNVRVAECKKIETMEVVHPSSREAVSEEPNSSELELCELKTSVEVDSTTAGSTSSVVVLPAERDSLTTKDATAVAIDNLPDITDSVTHSSKDRNAQDGGDSVLSPLDMDKVDHDSTPKKRVLDDSHNTTTKKMRALPGRSGHIDTIRMKRPNLTKIKLLLYTAGKLVHSKSAMNYDELFCDYWSAFSRRLEGPMNAFELTKNQNVLHLFLKSTSLRKLHNQLILGLMERCLDTKALVSDLSSTVPSHLRERMSIVTVKSFKEKRKEVENVTSTSDTIRQPPFKKFRTDDLSYTPVMLGPALLIEHSTLHLPQVASTRIPGALIIDPQVRKMAESHGLNASEHAIWLINVAVKQFTMSVLEKTLSTKEAVALGHVPPLLNRHFGISDKWGAKGKYVPSSRQAFSHHNKIIISSDLHIVMANLPISSRSLSGSISRSLFERSLGSAIGSGFDFGGSAFSKLKLHIIKMVTPTESNGHHSYSSSVPPTQILHHGPAQDSLSDRSTSSVRGLGRSAKDLAALKARASSVTPRPNIEDDASTAPVNESVGKPSDPQSSCSSVILESGNRIARMNSTLQTTNIRASPIGHRSAASKIPSLNDDVSAIPSANLDGLERVSGSLEISDSKSLGQSTRRGKGFGTKNLAAMMARSVSTSSDIAADLPEAANTDTPALPAADTLSITHDADLPIPTNKVSGNISKASESGGISTVKAVSERASVPADVKDITSIDAYSKSIESSQPKSSDTSEKKNVGDSMTSKLEDPVVQVQGVDSTKLDATVVEQAQVNDKPLVQVQAIELINVVSLSAVPTVQTPSDSNETLRQESAGPIKTDVGDVSLDRVLSISTTDATVLDRESSVATQANANAIDTKQTK